MARRKALTQLSVPVAHAQYKVRTVKGLTTREEGRDCKALGETEYERKLIYIEHDLAPGPWLMTFWHEWFHAVFHELGYEADSDNEAKVDSLAQAVTRFCSDPRSKALLESFLKKL